MEDWKQYYKCTENGEVIRIKTNKIMKGSIVKGYHRINLCINGIKKNRGVHRLIAEYFLPNPKNKLTVDHIDRNKLNNKLSNLRWATYSEQAVNRISKLNKMNKKNIHLNQNKYYEITFNRNKIRYYKYMIASTPIDQVEKQRDLMLSMF